MKSSAVRAKQPVSTDQSKRAEKRRRGKDVILKGKGRKKQKMADRHSRRKKIFSRSWILSGRNRELRLRFTHVPITTGGAENEEELGRKKRKE